MSSRTLVPLQDGSKNLSFGQRAAYIAAGLGMAASAARPRPNPLLNVLALAAGSYLAWSGYRGRCPVKQVLVDDRARVAGPAA